MLTTYPLRPYFFFPFNFHIFSTFLPHYIDIVLYQRHNSQSFDKQGQGHESRQFKSNSSFTTSHPASYMHRILHQRCLYISTVCKSNKMLHFLFLPGRKTTNTSLQSYDNIVNKAQTFHISSTIAPHLATNLISTQPKNDRLCKCQFSRYRPSPPPLWYRESWCLSF